MNVAARALQFAVACMILLPGLALADADQNCHLGRIAQLDMTTDASGRVSVPMTISGKPVNLLVDTGGAFSTLTLSTAQALGLPVQKLFGGYFKIYGGEILNRYVIAHDVLFAGVKGPELSFLVMSDGRLPPDEGGILAPDIMSQFDVDFDFANANFNIFSQDHCEGRVVYWTQSDPARIAIQSDRVRHLIVPLVLDGKEITAILDTGAHESTGSLDDIEDAFKLDEKSPDLKLLPNSNGQIHIYHYQFKTLSFGGVTVYNPEINLRPDYESHTRHIFLIGMNVLRHLHIYIAYKEHTLYVTPAAAHWRRRGHDHFGS